MAEQKKILIVEDDTTIAELIAENLSRWGYAVRAVADFSRVTDEFREYAPELVLLDISLPYYNGYFWCSEIRKLAATPVIFLSSHTESMDIVMAMNMGGDDYITKPFSMDVLTAKIGAVLRRAAPQTQESAVMPITGGARLLTSESRIENGEMTAELTKNELRILTLLIASKNEIVSREKIMMALWKSDSFIDDNTLTVNINRLRKKLEQIGITERVETKKGQGYMLRD